MLKIEPVGQYYKTSETNGWVYLPTLCPCICVGAHGGVQPKIVLIYED
jgi:hypothetical protein